MIQEELSFNGDRLRDEGMDRALFNNKDWQERVIKEIEFLSHIMDSFTADDVRIQCSHLVPTSGKAWGAVMAIASRMNLIKKTGRYVKSSLSTNHSRPNAEWTKA